MAARSTVRVAGASLPAAASASAIGQRIAAREVVELGHFAFEVERHAADRPVALLGDDDFGDVVDLLAMLLPALDTFVELLDRLVRPLLGLGALVIVLFA